MTITVTTAASNKAMLELATVKTRLGITGSAFDALLDLLIVDVSQSVARFLGYPPWRQAYTENLSGNGRKTLRLGRQPLEEPLTSVKYDDVLITDTTTYRIQDADAALIYHVTGGWTWSPSYDGDLVLDPSTHADRELWEIVYWAGWVMPADTPGGNQIALPADVALGAFFALRSWFDEEEVGGGIKSEKYGNVSVAYRELVAERPVGKLPSQAEDLLRGYVAI